jgi:hypothetical protein
MRQHDRHGRGGLIVLKQEDNEPLKDALALWAGQAPCEVSEGPDGKEHVEYWDLDDVTTLGR